MLVSEALSIGVEAHLTEEMVAFTCERCGQVTTAQEASVTRQGTEVSYACPTDGSSFGIVQGEGRGNWGFESPVEFAIQLDGAWVEWSELVERSD
jgi:predicted RNA-binding Zn-ribbon protein involved in translation (DUF1610 family)